MTCAVIAEPAAARARTRLLVPEEAADHLTRLYRLAWSMCGSPHLAEDLVQEAYVRVLARPRRLRRGDDFSYLARTLRNVLSDHRRQAQRLPATSAELEELDPPDRRTERDPEAAALARELYGAIADLPKQQRDVLGAVDVGGMSYRETARLLGIPIGTVMSRLARARARLIDTVGAGQ